MSTIAFSVTELEDGALKFNTGTSDSGVLRNLSVSISEYVSQLSEALLECQKEYYKGFNYDHNS